MSKIPIFFIIILFYILFNSVKPLNKNYLPEADFIQPWFCEYWSVEQWESHIEKMISAGYNELIIQNSIDIRNNAIEIFYNSVFFKLEAKKRNLELHDFSTMYDKIFEAIKNINKPFYISMGLTTFHEWNTRCISDPEFYDIIMNFEKNCISEILSSELYENNKKYISSLYVSYEMYDFDLPDDYENGKWFISEKEKAWGNYFTEIIEYIESFKDTEIPLFFSPYHSAYYHPSNETEYRIWRNFFSIAKFRKIDAIAPQDHFGFMNGAYTDEDGKTCKEHLISIKKACKEYSQAQFWINNEIFTKDYITADLNRVKKQFEINEELKPEKVISFSFSHYGVGHDPFFSQYIDYINQDE